jgi:hypothetical protein
MGSSRPAHQRVTPAVRRQLRARFVEVTIRIWNGGFIMRKFKLTEFPSLILLFAILNILLFPLFSVSGSHQLWTILLFELFLLGITIELSELVAATFVGECDISKLNHLDEYPPVAILYLVCDDIVPQALVQLRRQSYSRADIFILDDSNESPTQHLLDSMGFLVVRRKGRRGYKAGSLNNWLRDYGSYYKYFLVLDSDSIVPEKFVESLVKYAEHPANAQIAIFNSLPKCWNTHLRFPRLLSTLMPIQNWIRMRLANHSLSILSTGHNNLHRTEAIIEVGGFDEEFIAEDIAVTLKLVRAGYTSKLVNLIAFEAEPEHIFSYVRRLLRWAKQTVQIQKANWQGVPLSLKFQMFKLTWMYANFFLYPIWVVLIAWGAKSSLADVHRLLFAAVHGDVLIFSFFTPFIFVTILPLIAPFLKIPLLIKYNISLRDYMGSFILSIAIGTYTMLAVCQAQIAAATASTFDYDVTDKRNHSITLAAILFNYWYLIPFWLFLALGFWQNPVALIFSFLWILVLLSAPFLIYIFHEPRGQSKDPSAVQAKSETDLEGLL